MGKLTSAFMMAGLLASTVQAENWSHFRGPYFNGSTNETGLPIKFSDTTNVIWKATLPGPSAATPIIWEDHVFISTTDAAKETLMAMCFDRTDGRLLWSREVAKGLRRDSRSNFAAPSPATDGQRVVFFYGTGELVTYDMAGKELWRRNLQKDFGGFHFQWTFSTSPLIVDGKLVIQILQRDVPVKSDESDGKTHDSFLLALDPATGKELWRSIRPSPARGESREAFTTPTPFHANGKTQLLVVGGDILTSHDLGSGRELWRWGTWNPERIEHWRHVPSAVANDDVVLVCAPKREPVYAIKTGGRGELGDEALAWKSDGARSGISSDVPTPALYDGDFFVLYGTNRGQPKLTRVDPATGETVWVAPLPRGAKYEASPLATDGKIYVVNFGGQVTVVDAQHGELLHTTPMDPDGTVLNRASISAAHGRLFIRAGVNLYCVGTKK